MRMKKMGNGMTVNYFLLIIIRPNATPEQIPFVFKIYSSFANRALPFVTATPSFLAFSTISKRFFAPTADATKQKTKLTNLGDEGKLWRVGGKVPISAAYVRLYIKSIST